MHSSHKKAGFTLIEMLISLSVLILVLGMVVGFQVDLFSLNEFLTESFLIERKAQIVMNNLVAESREATQSSLGAYPIEIAQDFSFAFYSEVDSTNIVRERVHYFLDGTSLQKSVVTPAGVPLTYSTTTATETLRTVLQNVVASTTAPLFTYYDSAYAGTTTPLTQPVVVGDIRVAGINLIIDENPLLTPPEITVSGQVNIRNVKVYQ